MANLDFIIGPQLTYFNNCGGGLLWRVDPDQSDPRPPGAGAGAPVPHQTGGIGAGGHRREQPKKGLIQTMYCMNCGVRLGEGESCAPLCGLRAYHPELPKQSGDSLYPKQWVAPEPERTSMRFCSRWLDWSPASSVCWWIWGCGAGSPGPAMCWGDWRWPMPSLPCPCGSGGPTRLLASGGFCGCGAVLAVYQPEKRGRVVPLLCLSRDRHCLCADYCGGGADPLSSAGLFLLFLAGPALRWVALPCW